MTKNTTDLEKIGERILQQRTALNLSQSKVASLIGASQGVIAHWETGRSLPGTEYLTSLSVVLEVSIEWLLTGMTSSAEYVEAVVRPIQQRMAALAQMGSQPARAVEHRGFAFAGPENLTPIQQALLSTISDALKKGAFSDTECVKELPRWHELATSTGPAKAP
jgi:transcriptional regulator with XRE-family HTH domain